jgi:hypothetical protein
LSGYSNKLIARMLDITEGTVKVHLKTLMKKISAVNRTQAALWARSHGIGEDAHPLDTSRECTTQATNVVQELAAINGITTLGDRRP